MPIAKLSMKILAIEFSSEDRSVAVLDTANDAATAQLTPANHVLSRVCERGGRRAIDLVEQVLIKAGCEREEIDCIAVGIGPGSYTGIRGSISLAQGWQLGRGIKLLGVSSVECLAAQAQEGGLAGTVWIVIDAQRNEFYLAGYEIGADGFKEIEPLRLVAASEVERLCGAGECVVGPDASLRFPQARNFSPDAATLARLAGKRSDYVPGSRLEPIYLRQTDFKKAPPRRVIE